MAVSPEDQAALDAADTLPASQGATPNKPGGISPEDQAAIAAVDDLPPSGTMPGSTPDEPAPTRSLGPARLHMQAHQPRQTPPSAPPAAQPPPAPSWSQVPGLFAQNILPNTGQVIGQTLEALKPANWGHDVGAVNDLAVGALSKAGIYGGSAAQKKQDQALLDAVIAAKKQQWWGQNGEGLRRSLAYTPAEDLMDVATAASLVGAPAELAARAPGIVGDATAAGADAIARAARGVEGVTNPLSYPLKAANLAARAPGAVVRGVTGGARAATGAAGAATTAEDALRAVHPTEPIPTEMLTGEAAPPEAATQVANSRATWRGHAADAATALTGADAPDPAALGAALEKQQIAAHNGAIDGYDTVRQNTGQFAPGFAPMLHAAVDDAFKKTGLPPINGPGALSTLPGTYGKTLDAMKAMHAQVDDLAANNALTPNNLMNVRQEIGAAYRGASGSDVKGLRTLQDALDTHITNMANAGAYSGGDGAAVAASMRNAIDGMRNYHETFNEGPASTAVGLLRRGQVTDPTGRLTPSVAGTQEAVTANLGKGLINSNLSTPGTAPLLYNHLQKIMGGPGSEGAKTLDNFVRQSATRTNTVGDQTTLAAKPAQMQNFLTSPTSLSGKVFTPEEHAHLSNIAATDRLAQQAPARSTRGKSFLKSLVYAGSRHAAGAILGSHFGPPGAFAGEQFVSHVVDPMIAARTAAKAFKGAKRARASFVNPRTVATMANLGYGATPQSPQERQQEAQQNDQAITAAAPPVADVAKGADMGKAPPATPTDIDAVVRMAAAEGDQTPQGWQAVAAVMRNRALQSGQALTDVAAEPRQFEAYGNRNYTALTPSTPQYARILAAIAPVLAGKVDPTGGADSYYAPKLQAQKNRPKPGWDDGSGQPIGSQLFFHGKYRRPEEQVAARAAGGQVVDMTEQLMRRAERAQKVAQASTKPLLGLSDDTVARALQVAQRGF
jgi:hypothetical protein